MKILLQRTQDGCVIDDIRRFRTLINSMYDGFTVIAVSVLEFTNCNWMIMVCQLMLQTPFSPSASPIAWQLPKSQLHLLSREIIAIEQVHQFK
ncbi:hypothetical protein T05_8718 [Trichinella murrelli]|uniref:Uncharacterized protein n=1 Tax=Trichinella murrelli TaxID=144512 RepID=A0A0V0TYI6_9BILA|nr:hypothetical protein T05_8718 [Trichinella murrelli]